MEKIPPGPTSETLLSENARLANENEGLWAELERTKLNNEQLRLVADFSPVLISYVDSQERYRFMNSLYSEWFGFDPKESLGRTILEVVGQIPYEKVRNQIKQALEGKLVHFENRVVMKDKSNKIVDLQFVPFREKSGELNGFIILGYDITDRKQAESDLRDAQQRLEFALTSAKVSSWYLDLKTNQLSTAIGSKPLLGYEIERVDRVEAVKARVHPDDVDATLKALTQSIQERKPYQHEYRQIQENGTYRWMSSRAMPIYGPNDEPISMSGVMADITDTKQKEDLYQAITELTPQFVWMSDEKGAINFSNSTLLKYMGVEQMEVTGDLWLERIHPDDRERTIETWKNSLSSQTPYEIEFRIRSKDGNYNWFLNRALPLKNQSSGRIDRWLGVSTDINEQRKNRDNFAFLAETSVILSSSLDYHETLGQLAKVAVPTLADWCSITVVEDETPRGVAIAHPDPVMMRLADEFRTKYPTDWNSDTAAARVLRTGKSELYPWVTEEMVKTAATDSEHLRILQGLRIRSVMMVPIRGRDQILGLLTLVSSTDDRRYSENDLGIAEEVGRRAGLAIDNARLFTEARAAVQMRDEFLSIASHELKTPITSLGLQIQTSQRRHQKDESFFSDKKTVEKFLSTTSKQVDRLAKLVDSMLDISRITHGKLILETEEIDLGLLVRDVVDRFHEQFLAAGYQYQLNIESNLHGLWDRYRLEQVVTNLITNAIKYGNGKPIEISVFTENENAVLVVRDHGMGIAQDSLERIFDRFERAVTGNGISGLGLGLYISQQIAKAHNGRISVESEIDQGSSFRFQIPLNQRA